MADVLKIIPNPVDTQVRNQMQEDFRIAQSIALGRGTPVLTTFQWLLQMPEHWMYHVLDEHIVLRERIFWLDEKDHPYVGLGNVRQVIATGEDRFSKVAQAVHSVDLEWDRESTSKPRWFGGFSYMEGGCHEQWETWPDTMFFLPKYQFHGDPRSTQLECIVTIEISNQTNIEAVIEGIAADIVHLQDLKRERNLTSAKKIAEAVDRQVWGRQVARTAADIRAGVYEKVVLARMSEYAMNPRTSISEALRQLCTEYRDGFVFALYVGEGCFLGASPERLVRSVSGRVSIDCLAGTAPRGHSNAEDDELASELLGSTKNRAEHAVVVRWIRETVEPLVCDIETPFQPMIKKLRNVQHLFTPLSAQLRPQVSLLHIVEQLHPTPAVAGVPRKEALSVISERESFSRGWYAAPIGWLDADGNGDFAVGLRSALVQGSNAYLFAGAGIMGDSVPELEWEETELKMRPMKSALGISQERGKES